VAAVGFVLTGFLMHLLVDRLGVLYLAAQLVTTGIVLFWSFIAHKVWTFARRSGSATDASDPPIS
jgi:putative flippase GtrA